MELQVINHPTQNIEAGALAIMSQKGEAAPLSIFINAFQGKVVKGASDEELEAAISEALTVVNFELGWKAKDEVEYDLTVIQLRQDCRTFYPTLTLPEIKLACQLGARGHYGKFIALGVVTVNSWLYSYKTDLDRQKAKRLVLEATQPQLPEKPKELTRQGRVDFALKAFEEFKEKGSFQDYGNTVYDFLDSEGLITFDVERKKRIFDAVVQKETARLKADFSHEKDRFKRLEITKQLEKIGPEADKKNRAALLKNAAKREALNIFFGDLAEIDEDLNELLNPTD